MRRRRAVVALVGSVAVALLAACGDGDDASPAPVEVELSGAAALGAELAADNGCLACHSADGGRSTGPGWVGLAGSEVELEGGRTVVADAAYLRRAIEDPRAELRAGYAEIMPTSYEFSDTELEALIAYLEALGAEG